MCCGVEFIFPLIHNDSNISKTVKDIDLVLVLVDVDKIDLVFAAVDAGC